MVKIINYIINTFLLDTFTLFTDNNERQITIHEDNITWEGDKGVKF